MESDVDDDVDIKPDSDGYKNSGGEVFDYQENVLKEMKKINKSVKKTQSMLDSFMSDGMISSPRRISTSSDSPLMVSPRVASQEMANLKSRIDALEKFQNEMISKMNSEFITVLNKANDELSLQKIAIEELTEQVNQLKKNKK